MRTSLIFPALLASALCTTSMARPTPPVESSRDLWRDPVFRKQLLRSFGTLGEVEPKLADEEQELYAEISELIGDKPAVARDKCLTHLRDNPEASALFDFNAANIFFNQGNNARAAALFNTAIKKHAEFRRAHKNLAMVYFRMEKPDLAIKHFSEAIRLGENDGTLFGILGSCCLTTERYAQAESGFRNAILLQPELKEWHLGLAQSLLMQEQFGSAASVMGKMIEADPLNKDLWEMQARAYLGAEDNLKAAANFEFLDGIGALDSSSLKLLGDIYLKEQMFGIAADTYARSFAQGADKDPEAVLKSAEVLIHRGGSKEAAGLLAKIGATPDLADAPRVSLLRLRAEIANEAGDTETAGGLLEQALNLAPADGKAILMFGDHLRDKDELDRAELVYSRALDVKGFEADSRIRLAQTFVRKEDFRKAIDLLKQAQEIERRDAVGRYLEDLERFLKRTGG